MPKINGIGFNERTTPIKHEHLELIFRKFIIVTGNVIRKNRAWLKYKDIQYIDATAGDGVSPATGDKGSPLIFMAIKNEYRFSDLKFDCLFIDKNVENIKKLKDLTREDAEVRCIPGRYEDVIDCELEKSHQLGLLFIDPTSPSEFDFESIIGFCAKRQMQDVLIYFSATNQKRVSVQSPHIHLSLEEILKDIDKKHWWIREPLFKDASQWTFLFGSNYEGWGHIKSIGFHNIMSPEAQKFFETLCLTKQEVINKLQMRMF